MKQLFIFLLICLTSITLCYAQIDSVLVCDVKFKDSKFNNSHAGSGFILKYNNKFYGITAKHVLYFAKTDSMKNISFEGNLISWGFTSKISPQHTVKAGKLINENKNERIEMPPKGDWLVFQMKNIIPNDIAVYTLRDKPLENGESVTFWGYPYKNEVPVKVKGSFLGFTPEGNLKLDVPKGNYGGCSGGPVLDMDGNLVGIVSMGYFNQKEQKMIFEPASLDYFKEVIHQSTEKQQKIKYYRHLVFRESPFSDIRGNHAINQETAKHEAHYQFIYDNQGRLVEVSHRIGQDLIADNGNWDSFIWFSPKMTIEYIGNQEIRHYYDHLNRKIEAHGKMYKAIFDLDDEGRRTQVRFYDKADNPSESEWNIHRYQWVHLGDGKVLEKRFNLKDESQPIRPNFTFHTVRLEFGNDDLLDFVVHLDEDGNIINNTMKAGMDRIVYDQEENFSRWMVFDKDLKPVEGNAPEFAIGEHLYDCRGNKVELRGFDVIGKLKAWPSGVARRLNTYDSFNNQVEVKAYDLNGKLIQHIKQEFSKNGRRIEWLKFYDENGDITLAPNGQFAAINFEYNNDGSLAERKLYDADLKLISNK